MARVKEFNEVEVMDKAVELFWEKGYHATSANDLVNGLGLSRSSIYSTFTDKRTLFIKANKTNVESVLKTAIIRGQKLGQISKEHRAQELAQFIFNNVSGLRVAIKSNKEKKELKEVVNLCLSVLK